MTCTCAVPIIHPTINLCLCEPAVARAIRECSAVAIDRVRRVDDGIKTLATNKTWETK